MTKSISFEIAHHNAMASTIDGTHPQHALSIGQAPSLIECNGQEMNLCWRGLPFEIVTMVIKRLVDEDDVKMVMFSGGDPRLK